MFHNLTSTTREMGRNMVNEKGREGTPPEEESVSQGGGGGAGTNSHIKF